MNITPCSYCPRLALVTLILRNGFWRTALFLPERKVPVCSDHIPRSSRRRRYGG